MLVNYLVDISIEGNIIFRFSTADKEGYMRCLDGSSFSCISQQNAIVRGGELSTMGKTEITVVSKDVMRHIEGSGADLLGAHVSMRYQLNETQARAVFNNMQIVEFARKSEISFVLSLEDSAFAKAAPAVLTQPEQAEESGELSTRIGEEVWLPLKKLPKGKAIYGQGRHEDYFGEQRDLEGFASKRNGKLAFSRSFPLCALYNQSGVNPTPAFIVGIAETTDNDYKYSPWTYPEINDTLIGATLEVYAGKGAGDKYKIKDVNTSQRTPTSLAAASDYKAQELKLSPDYEGKVQPFLEKENHTGQGSTVAFYYYRSFLRPLPIINKKYGTRIVLNNHYVKSAYRHPQITVPFEESMDDDQLMPKDISFLRIINENLICYVITWKNSKVIQYCPTGSIKIKKADGSIESRILDLPFGILKDGDGYKILWKNNSDSSSEERIYFDGIEPRIPRYDLAMSREEECSATAFFPDEFASVFPRNGDTVKMLEFADKLAW